MSFDASPPNGVSSTDSADSDTAAGDVASTAPEISRRSSEYGDGGVGGRALYRAEITNAERSRHPPTAEPVADPSERTDDGGQDPLERARTALATYPELAWLVGDVEVSPATAGSGSPGGATLGTVLFPGATREAVAELDRTLVSLQAIDLVVADDYERFVEPQRADRLSPESFAELREFTLEYPELIPGLKVFDASHDLGKSRAFAQAVRERTGITNTDHDLVLAAAVTADRSFLPSLSSLTPDAANGVVNGIKTAVSVPSFAMAETVAANIEGLRALSPAHLRLHLLHSLYDVAGTAGHRVQNGSAVLTEPTYRAFMTAFRALEKLPTTDAIEVTDSYLQDRADAFGWDISDPRERALTLLVLRGRVSDNATAEGWTNVYDSRDDSTKDVLESELAKNGITDNATVVYYAPAILVNLQKAAAAGLVSPERAVAIGMETLARIYEHTRALPGRGDAGVVTVMGGELARVAAIDPETLIEHGVRLRSTGDDVVAELDRPHQT